MIIHLGSAYFPKNLIYLRKKYALSRRALARLTGLSEYRLEAIEKELCYPEVNASVLSRFRDIFQLTTEDLAYTDLEHNDPSSCCDKNRR